ncbi:glycosyltransferase, partial [Candidatus Bipolaricaulota bacterium]|nr:glycosyltransferase [Candidatus Bipolaricaulota bacterium]
MLAGVTLGIGVGFLLAGLGYLKTRWATRRLTRLRGRDDASVAVVIATRNEENVIENTLRTLLTTAPPGVRVLVVDESTDATPEILRRLTLEFPNLELLSDPQVRGKPAALNLALDHVTEDIVLLLDADARVDGAFLA